MNLVAGEFGFGIQSEALPAGKYWSRQVGMTYEMTKGHLKLLVKRRADYAIAYNADICRQKGLSTQYIIDLGYTPVDSMTYVDYKGCELTTIVYRRSEKYGSATAMDCRALL